jgi:hypothetical protein
MHDFLDRHVDTLVVDDPDIQPVRRRSQTELTMQVLMGGVWHRRKPNLANTACGQPIASQFCPLRREALADPLCGTCFTESERADAAERTSSERIEGDKP